MRVSRDPRPGPRPSRDTPAQGFPGLEATLRPPADHGEEGYRGSGRLEGLVALITGGDSGIGRAVAIAFAREGADVAVGYEWEKEEEDAEETRRWVERAGRRCLLHRFDVRDPWACEAFVGRVQDAFGRLDILVNNAGYHLEQRSILDITPEQLDRTFRTNVYGAFFMVQAALPYLKEGAVILNTGSITGLEGNAGLLDYSATKAALHNFTKALAESLADRGIRVNCVAPGPVWTPLIPSGIPDASFETFGADTYWKRPAQPAEIAPCYVFLASAESRYITGEIVAVTGKTTTR